MGWGGDGGINTVFRHQQHHDCRVEHWSRKRYHQETSYHPPHRLPYSAYVENRSVALPRRIWKEGNEDRLLTPPQEAFLLVDGSVELVAGLDGGLASDGSKRLADFDREDL